MVVGAPESSVYTPLSKQFLVLRELLERQTYAVGSVGANRLNLPAYMKRQKLKKGERTFSSTQNMLCFKWKDRKDVTILSTIHERPDFVDVVFSKRKK
ncbi:hypothetical protein J6590_080438 [Homalodisca vitripennis]|nr:hypothetical protein J6590_080438 [Homalodisca vitripennis]